MTGELTRSERDELYVAIRSKISEIENYIAGELLSNRLSTSQERYFDVRISLLKSARDKIRKEYGEEL